MDRTFAQRTGNRLNILCFTFDLLSHTKVLNAIVKVENIHGHTTYSTAFSVELKMHWFISEQLPGYTRRTFSTATKNAGQLAMITIFI